MVSAIKKRNFDFASFPFLSRNLNHRLLAPTKPEILQVYLLPAKFTYLVALTTQTRPYIHPFKITRTSTFSLMN